MKPHLPVLGIALGISLLGGCATNQPPKQAPSEAKATTTTTSYQSFDPNNPQDMAKLRAMLALSPADHKRAEAQASQLYRGMKLEAVEKVTGPLRKKLENSFVLLAQLGLTPKDDIVCSVTNGFIDLYFKKTDKDEYLLDQWKVRPQKDT